MELIDYGDGELVPYLERAFIDAFGALDPAFEFPVNPCPGRFQGERLIILDDGNARSAAPIWTKKVRERATVITTGGDLASGVPTSMGHKLGGPIFPYRDVAALHQGLVLLALGFGAPVAPAFPLQRAPFLRDVEFSFEFGQNYEVAGSEVLTRSRETEPDATIDTWVPRLKRGEDLERYAYVYTKAILAARRLHGR